MKEDLLKLINDVDNIEKLFHSDKYPQLEIINDKEEFLIWLESLKTEFNDLSSFSQNKNIEDIISALNGSFNGYNDKKSFQVLKAKLIAIKPKLDEIYEQSHTKSNKPCKVFISHSTSDKQYVDLLIGLLRNINLSDDYIFCTSNPGNDIPIDKKINDNIKEQFLNYSLYVLIVHSENYYKSPICLNEMGATWIMDCDCTSILLPGFDYKRMTGVINNDTIAIKLDNNDEEIKDKLNELYCKIKEKFNVPPISDVNWEKYRNDFIEKNKELYDEMGKAKVEIKKRPF